MQDNRVGSFWVPMRTTLSRRRIWVAVRFVLFGVGGFLLMMVFSMDVIDQTLAHHIRGMKPMVSGALAMAGATLTLFGVGEWRRWAYLSVFFSIPTTFALLQVLPISVTDRLSLPILAAILALLAWGSYVVSRRHYRRRSGG